MRFPRKFSYVFAFYCIVDGIFLASSTTTVEPPLLEEKSASAAVKECGESASSVFWPVFLTLIVVLAVTLIVYFFWKYYWRIRHGKHLVLVTDVEKGEPEFAFDNPGFREGTPVIQSKKLAANAKKEESNNSQKISNGHKPQSGNDSISNTLSADQETNVIQLKGRDFTGLGFNICGNKRDGIFVKDLLHHGPASETGRIKAGDRILAVRINFNDMEYKDAADILCSASPYEIEVEVEDSTMSPGSLKNASMNNHIGHSFFRSQSFSTAPQIQKIIPRKLNFNNSQTKSETPTSSKPAVLEVSEISDKMSKYGVKVLPDIRAQPTIVNVSVPVVNIEKQQNATVIDIQSDSGIETKTPPSFDEVDLSPPSTNVVHINDKPTLVSTFKDNNMKKVLVKGIQNLKEKLNNHMKSTEKLSSKENVSESIKMESKFETEAAPDVVDGGKTEDKVDLRLRSNSVSSDEMDDSGRKATSKRKAPAPPIILSEITKEQSDFNLLNEIENEVNKNNYERDSDSEGETETGSNTIELNSSHITVHHVPEESNRKAASLGDLSKIIDNDLPNVPLERAVSLELAEHTPRGSKKRKAPMPPEDVAIEESLFGKEPKLENGPKLKKSSLFGTLEEAMKPTDDESIPSDIENTLPSSTPMKLSEEENKFLSMDSYSNISWELNFDLQDDAKDSVFLDGDEKVPDLPTSPMPNLPTYVTEIKVSNDDDATKVNSSDVTLFMTAAEVSFNNNDQSEDTEVHILKTEANDVKVQNVSEVEDSKDDSSLDTVKEVSCNGTTEEAHNDPESNLKNAAHLSKSLKFSKENMSDEQILALSSSSTSSPSSVTQTTTPRHRMNNGDVTTRKLKSPSSTSRLPKLSQSVSPVRAVGSRIPVRANTEPSLKVSLINKDDIVSKIRKYKFSEDGMENGKVTFSSSTHLSSTPHKTSVLSENRHLNGPNR